jgi:UDP-N-acetylmuramoyl-tripeptide--D-alanyl-D-alanine ligase
MGARFDSAELRALFRQPPQTERRTYLSVSTDTRSLEPGALFVALRGERFDGGDFLAEAARRAARGAVVPAGRELPELDLEWFPVPDTTAALGELARHYRSTREARVIAITGSSGKTTVKEMLTRALSGGMVTHATHGNLNNQIGLPLSILTAPPDAQVWVLELGASAPGEIHALTLIAAPDDAVITTVGPAHLEGFGEVAGVLDEKLDLVRGSRPEGLVVVGELPDTLAHAARSLRADTIVAGLSPAAGFRPDAYRIRPTELEFERDGIMYHLPVGGEHHLRDALIAAATADGLGVDPELTAAGLSEYRPLGMRSSLLQAGGLTVVADCYNANPESFAAVIRYCADAFPGRRLAAVVGTMLELGRHSEKAHRSVASELLDAGFECIVALGDFGPAFDSLGPVRNGTTVACREKVEDAWDALQERLQGHEVVLVKASRGVRLEAVVDRIAAEYGAGEA